MSAAMFEFPVFRLFTIPSPSPGVHHLLDSESFSDSCSEQVQVPHKSLSIFSPWSLITIDCVEDLNITIKLLSCSDINNTSATST